MNKAIAIYVLKDPITNEVCYVGRTSSTQQREVAHRRSNGDVLYSIWLNWLNDNDTWPRLEIIEMAKDNGKKEEKAAIKKYWERGEPLFNNYGLSPKEKTKVLPRIKLSKWFKAHMGDR